MNGLVKRIVTALTIAALVVTAILLAPPTAFQYVVAVLWVLALMEFGVLLSRRWSLASVKGLAAFVWGTVFLGAALFTLSRFAVEWNNWMLLFVIAAIKLSDMGGFAFGVTAAKIEKGGTHKLCPTISPNKSWEGLVGSIIGSLIISYAFSTKLGFTSLEPLAFGFGAALLGTAGDLMESKFKRWVGVKDSSTMRLTAGLGGILDMIDSLLIAPGVFYVYWRFIRASIIGG